MRYLAGGHPRLLKVIFETWLKRPPTATNVVAYFAENSDVRQECERIFIGLHRPESKIAVHVANGEQNSAELNAIDHLMQRSALQRG